MKKLYKICAILLILAGLLLALVSPLFLLFSAAGIGFLLYNPKKPELKLPERKPEPEKKPEPCWVYKSYKIYNQNQEAVTRFFKNHEEELEDNSDYYLPNKELLEYFNDEKVYQFNETNFPCQIKGNEVWCEDGDLVGILKADIPENEEPSIVMCGGKFKFVGDDSVTTDKHDPWFYLETKKWVEPK